MTFPRTYTAIITERGDWESVPLFLQRYVQKFLKDLSAMHDEAEGKFGDEDPTPFRFKLCAVEKLKRRINYIKKQLKELGRED